MPLNYEIPNEDMDGLVCSSCNNYLSVFPIYLTNDNSAVCGRCTHSNKDFIRDVAYEAIAEFLQFPCCYKRNGCEERLSPHKLEEHEPACLFRILECPSKAYTRCKWLGHRTDLIKHFEENHLHLLLKTGEFKLNLDSSVKENLLKTFEDELFIVKKDFDARKQNFSCSVERFAAQSNSNRYSYLVKLLSDDRESWCKLPVKTTENGETVTADDDCIKLKLNCPAFIVVQIEIFKSDNTKQEYTVEKTVSLEKNADLDWEVLNELVCPVCYIIISSEIYQCTGGHSICNECKPVVKNCPLCRKDVLDTRNYALEKLIPFLTYPCKFHKDGCTYTSKCKEIKNHEENCNFGPFECPLKENCQVKIDRSRIVDHFERYHRHLILKSNRITSPFDVAEMRECLYLMKFLNNIFLVQYKYTNRQFYWTVQLIGTAEDCKKFKFDIDVIDNSKRKLRCYMKGFCVPIQEKIDFENPLKYIMLTYEQLQPMITTTLDYNIHIVKE
ncbi:uncharacterized protein LOC108906081 [Anoplophora glabripennis]|uniref:uncharacterized protein LOC108906081 n=1 Tax=Anoplophora glabripennis TaxID=217634 RepID=UPI000875297E|nr:uncharacterized protein LOC108906081 [Anoplophora glabripennis]